MSITFVRDFLAERKDSIYILILMGYRMCLIRFHLCCGDVFCVPRSIIYFLIPISEFIEKSNKRLVIIFCGVVDTGRTHNRRYPHIDEAVLNNSISFAQSLVDRMSTLERNIANAGVELMAHTPAGKQFLDSYPSEDAFERGLDAIVAMKASSYLLHQSCHR